MAELKVALKKRYKMKDMGELSYILGISVVQDHANNCVFLHQNQYIEAILRKYGMDSANPVTIPVDANLKLKKTDGVSKSVNPSTYQSMERLVKVNGQMGRPELKLMQEVDTRWNSTYHMLQRIYDLREPVGAALAGLRTDIVPLSSEHYAIIADCLKVLSPFSDATVELSEEKKVSGSKVIPLLTMLHHALEEEDLGFLPTPESRHLVDTEKATEGQALHLPFQEYNITGNTTGPQIQKNRLL
ncbi:hypothetical protein GJAV_G00150870 [Gymnothorax javanicus]|nr:hypothetical protein GJAV_G00150870 [Gymnothorax javanicus]